MGKAKKFIQLFLFVVMCIITSAAFARKLDSVSYERRQKNSISIVGTNYFFPDLHGFGWNDTQPFSEQIGIFYDRKIYKEFSIGIGYSKWNDIFYPSTSLLQPAMIYVDQRRVKGALNIREKYKIYDIFIKRKHQINKKNNIIFGLGLSYTQGINNYFDSLVYTTNSHHASILYSHFERRSYLGFAPSFSYDYMFFKNYCSIGGDVRTRKYFGLMQSSVQIDFGIHIGFNF